MCKCGCNTCETKGPLLTEDKVKSLLSKDLLYHIDKKIPLFETTYRIGSKRHLSLIKEARKMYSRNIIDLCEEDEALIKTNLKESNIPSQEEVNKFFLDTQQEIHYLNSKPVKDWDEYDMSNWKSKLRKKELGRPQFGESLEELKIKRGSYPATLVVSKDGKVIKQEEVKTPALAPALYRILRKKYPEAIIKLEDSTGKIINESQDYDEVAQSEFGMDYDQLGSGEKEWVRDEIDNMSMNESNSNYPDFDLDKNIKYQDTSISSGMWRYTGKEQGGKGVYRNLNNDQFLGFSRDDFDFFKKHLGAHFDMSESLNEGPIDRIIGGIPFRYENGKAIITEPLDDATKERIIRKAKENGYRAAPNMAGGVTIHDKNYISEVKKSTNEQKKETLKDKVKVGVREALQNVKRLK
jgi:hypothetical protein